MMARTTTVVAGSMLLVSILSACATNVGGGYSLDPGRSTGLAVVSLTASGLPTRFNLFVNLRGMDTAYKRSIPVTDFFTTVDWRCPRVGTATEAEPCGRLAVIELRQGEYEFYAWEGGTGAPGVRGTVRSKEEFSKRFRVLAGQAVYIGNIHFAITPPQFLTDQGTGTMKISDLRVRDLPLLHEKHPRVTPDRVVVSILPD
jgi:hypothetical protein